MEKEQIKTAKFGGSSLADAAHFRKVKEIVEADPARRYIVPSAPGRRSPEDEKVTDLLYRCYQECILRSRLPQFYGKDPEAISGYY